HGEWEVEISCDEGRVRQVVESVLSSLDSKITQLSQAPGDFENLRSRLDRLESYVRQPGPKPIDKAKSGLTCRGLTEILWEEGFFTDEKSLGEVHEELARRGYNYDRTAVSHTLIDLVREGTLTRTGTMRNFRYLQKRPAEGRAA